LKDFNNLAEVGLDEDEDGVFELNWSEGDF
jgi:hypothetical protein